MGTGKDTEVISWGCNGVPSLNMDAPLSAIITVLCQLSAAIILIEKEGYDIEHLLVEAKKITDLAFTKTQNDISSN
jgi:hypothetical protein